MTEYFEGKKLYGDDFSPEQIKVWYEEETEGYADLGSKDKSNYTYGYHILNQVHGYDKIKGENFENVLGFGSAYGNEFEPILERIENLTIIEPSDNLINNKIGNLIPSYVKPSISGKLDFEDNTFDLINSFGTLHHIPNVSYVLGELIRVLKPQGFLLIREPIISMGDWRKPRKGLTKNERGIPVSLFDEVFDKYPVEVVYKGYCFSAMSIFQRIFGPLLKKPIYTYKSYIILDKFISKVLKNNLKYHATRKIERLSPQSIFYVVKKA